MRGSRNFCTQDGSSGLCIRVFIVGAWRSLFCCFLRCTSYSDICFFVSVCNQFSPLCVSAVVCLLHFEGPKAAHLAMPPLLPASASWRTSGSAPGGQVPRVHRPLGAVPSCLPQEPKVLALHFICLGAGTRARVDFCVFDRPHRCNGFLSSDRVFAIARCGAAATP